MFPRACACCGDLDETDLSVSSTRQTGVRVVRSDTRSWGIPYCHQCVAHATTWPHSPISFWTLLVLGAILGGSLGVIWGWKLGSGIFAAVALPLLAVRFHEIRKQNQALALTKPTCCCVGPAVTYLGWDGSVHSFWVVSEDYTAMLAQNNAGKVLMNRELEALLGWNEERLPQRRQ